MKPSVRNALIGFAVTVAVSFVLGFFGGGAYSALLGVILGIATWYILMNLSGNRSTRTIATADRDALLAQPPPSGSAIVYVARQGFAGGMAGFDIVLDGEQVAQLKSPQMTRLVVTPGAHTLRAGPGGFAGTQNRPAEHDFVVAADETAVFVVRVSRGLAQNQCVVEPGAMTTILSMPMVAAEQNVGTASASS